MHPSTGKTVQQFNSPPCSFPAMAGIGDRVKERRVSLGLSQDALAKKAGIGAYQTVQDLESGKSKGTKHLLGLAKALGVTPDWLQDGPAPKAGKQGPVNHQPGSHGTSSSQSATVQNGGGALIEVMGMAECGPDGWSLWNGEIIDRVPRPANLAGVPKAYAVYVMGTSMEDRYHPGELAFIHPGKPVTPGCYVLVQLQPKEEGSAPRAVLKKLVRRSGDKVILAQLAPPKNFTIKTDEILSMHRVVGSGEA